MNPVILMYGLRGCLPLFCEEFESKSDAVNAAIDILDLAPHGNIAKDLRAYEFAECQLDGIEYIEISS